MNVPYSREDIEKMKEARDLWVERKSILERSLIFYQFKVPAAREMMQHGVSRRFSNLEHTLGRVFEVIPPEADAPSPRDLQDATAFLQAFVINIFGVVDNLAWLWALEADVRDRGQPVHRMRIGFTPDHLVMRASVSERTRSCLERADRWFGYQEDYRHALAHRIPLYIPPSTVDEADVEEFQRLESVAIAKGPGSEHWTEMLGALRKLGTFEPLIMHSYGEGARPIKFHGQMINDFATVTEIGEHVAQDLHDLGK